MEFVWDIPPLVVQATQFYLKLLCQILITLDMYRQQRNAELQWVFFFGLAIIANLNLKLWAMEMEWLESVPFLRAAPVRMSLIRVTEECKVGGLGDRFLSMFRAEHLTET